MQTLYEHYFGENLKFSTEVGQYLGDAYEVNQIHETELLKVRANQPASILGEGDGLYWIGEQPNYPLLIKTADCVPVVLLGKLGGAHIHMGHRGLSRGILENNNLCELKPYKIFLGPSIRECCYEVSIEFLNSFDQDFVMSCVEEREERIYFSLQKYASIVVKNYYRHEIIDVVDSGVCTHCVRSFYSYRREKTKKRNLNFLYFNKKKRANYVG